MLKWTLIVVSVLVLLYGTSRLYASFVMNPNAVSELRVNPDGDRAGIVMLMTFPDGKLVPVNYLREENKVFVGADGPWWREFQDGGLPVTLEIRGETMTGHAIVVLDDPEYTERIFKRLRPNVPEWLPDWLNGKLVVITLAARS